MTDRARADPDPDSLPSGGASRSVSIARGSPKPRQTAARISIVSEAMVCIVSEAEGPVIAPRLSDVLARNSHRGHGPSPPIVRHVHRRWHAVPDRSITAGAGCSAGARGMKRVHINITVTDLDHSIGFYTTLFGTGPTVLKGTTRSGCLRTPVSTSRSRQAAAPPAWTISASRPRPPMSSAPSPGGSRQRASATSIRRMHTAAMRAATRPGSSTRRAWPGRPSTPPAPSPITARTLGLKQARSRRPRMKRIAASAPQS